MRYCIEFYKFLHVGKTPFLYCIADEENLGDTKEVFCKKLKKIINCAELRLDIGQLRSVFRAEFYPQRKEYQFHGSIFYMDIPRNECI